MATKVNSHAFLFESGMGHILVLTDDQGNQSVIAAKPLSSTVAPFALSVHSTMAFNGAESEHRECEVLNGQPCHHLALTIYYDQLYPASGNWREKTAYLRKTLMSILHPDQNSAE